MIQWKRIFRQRTGLDMLYEVFEDRCMPHDCVDGL